MIANCGWLKNICKKVANATKKVVNQVANFVHENADVIVPLAIGVIGGLTGGAALPVLIAGTVAGAVIDGTKTAVQTYKATGKVDWAATGISAGIGAAVGLVATYTGYNIGSALRQEANNTDSNNINSNKTNNSTSKLPQTKYDTSKLQHEWKHASDFGIEGNWNKANASAYQNAIQNHINNVSDIFKSTYRGEQVYVYINQTSGLGAYVDMSGNYIGGWKFTAEQILFHIQNGIRIK